MRGAARSFQFVHLTGHSECWSSSSLPHASIKFRVRLRNKGETTGHKECAKAAGDHGDVLTSVDFTAFILG